MSLRDTVGGEGAVPAVTRGPELGTRFGMVAADVSAGDDIAGLQPLAGIKRRWPALLGALLTLMMIVGLGRELFDSGLAGLYAAVPASPLFYVAFALLYMAPPFGDYVIFRRLWNIPLSGLVALLKKRIANDVVLGYSGEAYFYAWARQRAHIVAAPFGAVKDVSILSAIAGNSITLATIGLAVPFAMSLLPPAFVSTVWGSVAAVFALSLPFLVFSKRVFSLPRPQLLWIFAVHCLRLIASSVLVALAWHFALPVVSLGMWLMLAAARLLVSRLPFLPNKDLLFANFAIILIGADNSLSDMLAFTAALTLLVHVALIGAFALQSVAGRRNGQVVG